MDLTRDILYRGFKLNDASIRDNIIPGNGIGRGISGCVVDSVQPTDVDVIQFTEKRSLQDGLDAGDVFLGARRLRMAGTIYATTRSLLYDQLQAFCAALSPTLAQRDSPGDKGYVPLYFSVPTNRVEEFPAGAIDMQVLALPRGIDYVIQRDQVGGDDADSLAIPWQAVFVMRNPRKLAALPVDVVFEANQTGTVSGNLTNRGDYHASLNALFSVGAAGGSIALSIGGSNFTITVPASTGTRLVRYKGEDKVLTVEEGDVESLRMDLLTFAAASTHPLISGGVSPYSVTFTGVTLQSGSHLWVWESWA